MTAIAPPRAPIAPAKKATSTIGGASYWRVRRGALQPAGPPAAWGLGSTGLVRDDRQALLQPPPAALLQALPGAALPGPLPAPVRRADDEGDGAAERDRARIGRRRRRADHALRDRRWRPG